MLNEIMGKRDITNDTTKVLAKYLSKLQHTSSEKKTAAISRELVEEIIDLHGLDDFYDEIEISEPEPKPEPKPEPTPAQKAETPKAKAAKLDKNDMQLFVEYLKEDQKFRDFLKSAIETAEKEEQEVRIFYKDKASKKLYSEDEAKARLAVYGSDLKLEQLFLAEVYVIDEDGKPGQRASADVEARVLKQAVIPG